MIAHEGPDEAELRAALRRLLSRVTVSPDVDAADGYDPALWARLTQEIGVAGLGVPERFGGAGAGPAALAVVAEELGRTLAPTPFLATVGLGLPLLLGIGDDVLLPDLAAGRRTAAVVYRGPEGEVGADHLPVRLDGTTLTGSARYVVDGHLADVLLVVASSPSGPRLVVVEAGATGLTRRPMRTLDRTRAQSSLTFQDTPGRVVEGDAWAALEQALDVATVLLAAEQLAGAERVVEMAVGYAKDRRQFGRPIGSFQAIKHRLADLVVDNDRARSAVAHAVWAAVADPGRLPAAAAMAADVAGPAYRHAAQENVQVHGGIGFTWEHPAHLYVRRSTSDAVLLRNPDDFAERLLVGIGVVP